MRASDLETCVVRIEDEQGRTLGTGFLVGPYLAVTCAHVVRAAGAGPGQAVAVCFHQDRSRCAAQVLARPWSPPDEEDVAFLRLESVPEEA